MRRWKRSSISRSCSVISVVGTASKEAPRPAFPGRAWATRADVIRNFAVCMNLLQRTFDLVCPLDDGKQGVLAGGRVAVKRLPVILSTLNGTSFARWVCRAV